MAVGARQALCIRNSYSTAAVLQKPVDPRLRQHPFAANVLQAGHASRVCSRLPFRTRESTRKMKVVCSAADGEASQAAPKFVWQGTKPIPTAAALAIGLVIRYIVPVPDGITEKAWSLLAIFTSTVFGLVLDPLPVGAWAMIAVTSTLVTKTLTFAEAFSAMTNEVIWLIVVSFFFAKGFEKTGLGERIANMFVKAFGKSTLGLALSLNVAEALLSPAMPSTSARAGGIFMPIIKSLSTNAGSNPGDDSRQLLGSYLTQAQFQTGVHSSCLFLTAAAQNLLCLKLAAEVGAVVPSPFNTWALGACVPAVIGLFLTPWLLYQLQPPLMKETPEAPMAAAARLQTLGPMKVEEKIMLATMGLAVGLWMFGDALGIAPVTAALLGLSVLLFTGVLSWRDCLTYPAAWDTLVWFAVLIGLSGQLNAQGVIKVFASSVGGVLSSMNLAWPAAFGVLHAVFFLLHYLFASQTAHVGALYAAFCAMMLSAGVPPVLAAMSLAYNVNLFGSITHYASGQAAVYYGAGYMSLKEVFSMGGICGVVAMALWAVVGMPWWKFLGWW